MLRRHDDPSTDRALPDALIPPPILRSLSRPLPVVPEPYVPQPLSAMLMLVRLLQQIDDLRGRVMRAGLERVKHPQRTVGRPGYGLIGLGFPTSNGPPSLP